MEKTEEIRMNSNKNEKFEIGIELNLLSPNLQLTIWRRPTIYKIIIYNLKDEALNNPRSSVKKHMNMFCSEV